MNRSSGSLKKSEAFEFSASVVSSVADPDPQDPYVFGPPESVSGSNSTRYGSGSRSGTASFCNQAKIVILNPTVFFCDFFMTSFIFKK
jgi:hypothetical protein